MSEPYARSYAPRTTRSWRSLWVDVHERQPEQRRASRRDHQPARGPSPARRRRLVDGRSTVERDQATAPGPPRADGLEVGAGAPPPRARHLDDVGRQVEVPGHFLEMYSRRQR